jgi:hypothetical protein
LLRQKKNSSSRATKINFVTIFIDSNQLVSSVQQWFDPIYLYSDESEQNINHNIYDESSENKNIYLIRPN